MKIIIVGLGKVGMTLAEELCQEDNDIAVIDKKAELVEDFAGRFDLLGVIGNGATHSTQKDAGIEDADLLIAVTGSDELNLLCCLIAKEVRECSTIARVRNPDYNSEIDFIRERLGLTAIINQDLATAMEIARILRFPSAIDVDSFTRSKVDILRFLVRRGSKLDGMQISAMSGKVSSNVLVCAVERGEEVIIPNGNTVLHANDKISIVADNREGRKFFREVGADSEEIKDIIIVGGSPAAFYLAQMLEHSGTRISIMEKSMERCETLSELLPNTTIIQGDGTDKDLLLEEGLEECTCFAALTNVDEENILISLYAKKTGVPKKIITKINRIAFDEVIREMDLDTIIHPREITAELIIRYVRSMKNSYMSNVESLHKIVGGKAEALEFLIRGSSSRVTSQPLAMLPIRDGVLVACIYRDGKTIIPKGSDRLQMGDNVIIVSKRKGLDDIEDILV